MLISSVSVVATVLCLKPKLCGVFDLCLPDNSLFQPFPIFASGENSKLLSAKETLISNHSPTLQLCVIHFPKSQPTISTTSPNFSLTLFEIQ